MISDSVDEQLYNDTKLDQFGQVLKSAMLVYLSVELPSSSWEYWLVNYGIEAGNQLWLCLCDCDCGCACLSVSDSDHVSNSRLTLTVTVVTVTVVTVTVSRVWLNLTHHSDSRDWVETVSVWIEIAFGFDAIFHGSRLIRHDIASFHYALFCVVQSRI